MLKTGMGIRRVRHNAMLGLFLVRRDVAMPNLQIQDLASNRNFPWWDTYKTELVERSKEIRKSTKELLERVL